MVSVNNNGHSTALIQVRGLNKTYRRGGEEIQASIWTSTKATLSPSWAPVVRGKPRC